MKTLISWMFALLLCQICGAMAAPDDDYRAGTANYRAGDVVQAIAVLKKSAEAGHAPSQAMLGYIMDKAEFNEEAAAYYRKAAAQGNADGEYGLGAMYAAGNGVKQDPMEARMWITRAAEKGHIAAIESLAHAFITGGLAIDEPQRNSAEALRWVRRAAENSYLPAIERLADAYRSGAYGLAIDLKLAEDLDAKGRAARGLAAKGAAGKKEKK